MIAQLLHVEAFNICCFHKILRLMIPTSTHVVLLQKRMKSLFWDRICFDKKPHFCSSDQIYIKKFGLLAWFLISFFYRLWAWITCSSTLWFVHWRLCLFALSCIPPYYSPLCKLNAPLTTRTLTRSRKQRVSLQYYQGNFLCHAPQYFIHVKSFLFCIYSKLKIQSRIWLT